MLKDKKRILLIGLMITAIFLLTACGSTGSGIVLQGKTEADILAQNIQVSGQIINSPIEAGQPIKKGDIIAVLDDSDQVYAIEQLAAEVSKKQASLNNLNAGNTSQEIEAAQSAVEAAKSNYTITQQNSAKAKNDYDKNAALAAGGAITTDALRNSKYAYDTAKQEVSVASANLNKAKAQLDLLQSGAKSDDVAYAQADLQMSLSKLAQAKDDLKKFTLYADCDGTVVTKNYLLNDVVNAGYNLAEIANTEQMYVVAYMPKEYVNDIEYGQQVTLTSGSANFKGTISYIALKSEYTPEDLQSSANKNKQNVKIKVKLVDGSKLKPAEPVKVNLTFNK